MPHRLFKAGELALYGPVGFRDYDGDGFLAQEVLEALAEAEGDITVRINSGGGIAWDGIAIFNALAAHQGHVTTVVDGVAASAASLIAMAGETRVMREGALFMIHDAAGLTMGDAEAHRKTITVLDKLSDQYAGIYARRSGGEAKAERRKMKAETWLDAEEAVAAGYFTEAEALESAEPAAFDYSIYANAPASLQALSDRWIRGFRTIPAAIAAHRPKETSMTDKPKGGEPAETITAADRDRAVTDATSAERARIGAILNHDEAKGRDDLAKHFAFDTAMTAEAAVAALAKAPKAAAPAPAKPDAGAQHLANQAQIEAGLQPVESSAIATVSAATPAAAVEKTDEEIWEDQWKANADGVRETYSSKDAFLADMRGEKRKKARQRGGIIGR